MKIKHISILTILLMLLAASVAMSIRAFKSGHNGFANSSGERRDTGGYSSHEALNESGPAARGFSKAKPDNSASEQARIRPNDKGATKRNAATGSAKSATNMNANNGKFIPNGSAIPAMSGNESALVKSRRKIYEPFLKKYPLTDEQLQLVADANKKSDITMSDLTRQGKYGPGVDTETLTTSLDKIMSQYDEVRESLGDEAFEALMYYQNTLTERILANEIAGQINLSGSQLSDEKIDSLIDIFDKNYVGYSSERFREKSATINNLTLKSLTQTRDNVLKESSAILTSEQMDVMRQYWDSLLRTMEETKAKLDQD